MATKEDMDLGAYAAFFRGINVGGKGAVKMSLLAQMMEGIAHSPVRTYIQSGNVVFCSEESERVLKERIEQSFEKTFGFTSCVILRNHDEISTILTRFPFSEAQCLEANSATDAETRYVFLYDQIPPHDTFAQIISAYDGKDMAYFEGRELYLLIFESIRDSKLANALLKMPGSVTVRNWNTMMKISQLFG